MKTITYGKLVGVGASLLLIASASNVTADETPVYVDAVTSVNLVRDQATTGTGVTQVGDQITLEGTDRQLTHLQYEYFLGGSTPAHGQLTLYANNGPTFNGAATPGTVLFSGPLTALPTGFHTVDIPVSGATAPVPNNFTWAVSFTGVASDTTVGLLFADTPLHGSSTDDFWANTSSGWQLLQTSGVADNFAFAAYAVPEPTTLTLLLGGAGILSLLGFRRKA